MDSSSFNAAKAAVAPAPLLEALAQDPELFIGVADDTGFRYVNGSGAGLFGYGSPGEMKGLSWEDLLADPPETPGGVVSAARQEARFRRKDDQTFQGLLFTQPFADGDESLLLVTIRPIESYKQAERHLEREKQRFEALFEHATMGIVVADQQGRVIQANRYALEEFGYQKAELIGAEVERLIPGRFNTHHTAYRHAYHAHPEIRPMGAGRDLFALRKDGSEFPVEISLSPYRTEEGLFIIAFIIDISVRREKEEEIGRVNTMMRELNDALERKVEERTHQLENTLRELEASRDELSQSLEKEKELNDMKSRFVTMASHEFRTPLSTILSSASLLSKYSLTEDQPKREKHVQRIKSAVNNLTGILNEFLSLGKMEGGGLEVHCRVTEVVQLLEAVSAEMREICQPGQEIRYQHRGAGAVFLDPELLRNVMINLLSNAIKFSPENGLIEVESVVDEAGVLVIRVSDRGIGIPEADREHLFERFFRARNAVNIQGTGLGLHIVAKYMELMGGSVSWRAGETAGTTFLLRFEHVLPPEGNPNEIPLK